MYILKYHAWQHYCALVLCVASEQLIMLHRVGSLLRLWRVWRVYRGDGGGGGRTHLLQVTGAVELQAALSNDDTTVTDILSSLSKLYELHYENETFLASS